MAISGSAPAGEIPLPEDFACANPDETAQARKAIIKR
jgi:hypothetical protein